MATKNAQIIVDVHEAKNMGLMKEIKREFQEVIEMPLEVGDFIIGDMVIERKSSYDLVSRYKSNGQIRIFDQVKRAKQSDINFVIIVEGSWEDLKHVMQIPEVAIFRMWYGVIHTLFNEYHVPVYVVSGKKDTARLLRYFYQKHSGNPRKVKRILRNSASKKMSLREQVLYVLQGFPGIGALTSKKLINEYGSLYNVILALAEDIIPRKLLGKSQAERARSVLIGDVRERNN